MYVTHPDQDFTDLKWVHTLKNAGINWIQLRFKEEDFNRKNENGHYQLAFIEIADQLTVICNALKIILSINDNDSIYNLSNCSGIHLGLSDKRPNEIFKNSPETIIGISTNTVGDLNSYPLEYVNYIGLGPFRKTNTKLDTKEELGISGYKDFIKELAFSKIDLPVYAIGGITVNDIQPLKNTGVYGFALSGEIFDNIDSQEYLETLVKEVEQ